MNKQDGNNDPPLYYGPLPQRYSTIITAQSQEPKPIVILNDVKSFFCSHFDFKNDDFANTIPTEKHNEEDKESSDMQTAIDLMNMRNFTTDDKNQPLPQIERSNKPQPLPNISSLLEKYNLQSDKGK